MNAPASKALIIDFRTGQPCGDDGLIQPPRHPLPEGPLPVLSARQRAKMTKDKRNLWYMLRLHVEAERCFARAWNARRLIGTIGRGLPDSTAELELSKAREAHTKALNIMMHVPAHRKMDLQLKRRELDLWTPGRGRHAIPANWKEMMAADAARLGVKAEARA